MFSCCVQRLLRYIRLNTDLWSMCLKHVEICMKYNIEAWLSDYEIQARLLKRISCIYTFDLLSSGRSRSIKSPPKKNHLDIKFTSNMSPFSQPSVCTNLIATLVTLP